MQALLQTQATVDRSLAEVNDLSVLEGALSWKSVFVVVVDVVVGGVFEVVVGGVVLGCVEG